LCERASPLSFTGPNRFQPPGIKIKNLPKIDVILISHNHYNSFDKVSIKAIATHNPKSHIIVPLGDGALAREWGMKNVREMGWYGEVEINGVTL
jgi:N-acyl-phosphatidylethanolamine-hydrolysing phospholipase D